MRARCRAPPDASPTSSTRSSIAAASIHRSSSSVTRSAASSCASSQRGIAARPPASSSSTPRIRRTGCRRRRRNRSKSIAGSDCAGAAPRRRGSARRRWSADSRRSGFFGVARGLAKVVSRGGLSREDEGILAPVWKLPPEARRPLRRFWTQEKFFDGARQSDRHDLDERGGDARRIGARVWRSAARDDLVDRSR